MARRIVVINVAGIILSVALAFVLSLLSITSAAWSVLYAFLSAILVCLLSIVLEIHSWPKPLRYLRKTAVEAQSGSESHPVLSRAFNEVLRSLKLDLANISHGVFVDARGSVPQLSLDTIAGVREQAFATFLPDTNDAVYADPMGLRYLQLWYEKAKDLPFGKVQRLFILNGLSSCSPETLQLIEKHVEQGISVGVISREKAEQLSHGNMLDFALFDKFCLMTVKNTPLSAEVVLSVYVGGARFSNSGKIEQYKIFSQRLLANCHSYSEFKDFLVRPLNEQFWDHWLIERNARLPPPHGVSRADALQMLDTALSNLGVEERAIRMAILGVTPELVDSAASTGSGRQITLIDQTNVSIPIEYGNVFREEANWLDYKSSSKFHCVLGDEAFNNLSLGQYSLFFRNISDMMVDGGVLVLRVLGRFGPKAEPQNGIEDLVREAREHNAGDDTLACSEILRYVHSEAFGFNSQASQCGSEKYNSVLDDLVREGKLTCEQAEPWYFPYRGAERLLLSIPSLNRIVTDCSDYFTLLPLNMVDRSYAGDGPVVDDHYKILGFVARSRERQPIGADPPPVVSRHR